MSCSEPPPQGESDGADPSVAEPQAQSAQSVELATPRVRHEINNVLTGLLGQVQLLQREELSETAQRRVKTIEQLVVRIKTLADQLRDV